MDYLTTTLSLWLTMLHSIYQSSFQAQRSSSGPDVGFDRVWLVNCPSQRGARTPWQITFFNPRFQHHCSKFVRQKFYNSRNSANQTWICLDLFTQDDSVSRLVFSSSTAELGCTSTGFTQGQIVCLYTNEPPLRSLLKSLDFVSILEEPPSLWERSAFSGTMQVLASSAEDMEALGLALFWLLSDYRFWPCLCTVGNKSQTTNMCLLCKYHRYNLNNPYATDI